MAILPRPKNVGVLAMDMYFPLRCISEAELEDYNGVSKGKYTIGLGQEFMAWADDREDINSFALNAVSGLLEKYKIDRRSIGRIEVGTETIIDKSKSVQSVLMSLFAECGNHDIEGIDSKNACYGSTAALYNAINWIESSSWDGRNAIVVAGDIAVYAEGSARPAGGAGAVAMLIGPDAPVVFDPVHGSYMADTYDFYKPELASEYPHVDGPGSITTYLQAFDASYACFKRKLAHQGHHFSLEDVDYALFHSPYGKQTVKGHARMLYNDFLADPGAPQFAAAHAIDYSMSPMEKHVEKLFIEIGRPSFTEKVHPTMACSRRLGNLYTGSLYACLASLLSSVAPADLLGKRASLYAFGGGCAASFFTLRVVGDTSEIRQKMDLLNRLARIKVVSCKEFTEGLRLREVHSNAPSYTPVGSVDNIAPSAYYLHSVDDKFRRRYVRA